MANPAFAATNAAVDNTRIPYAKLRSLSMSDVKWTTGFWAERFELCHKSMLPTLYYTMLKPRCHAQLNCQVHYRDAGQKSWGWTVDGDCCKWIDTIAHVCSVKPDPERDQLMDEWIAIIAKAQDEDGYISTNIGHDKAKRLQMPYLHECYNMGHLLTAACIHHRVTGNIIPGGCPETVRLSLSR